MSDYYSSGEYGKHLDELKAKWDREAEERNRLWHERQMQELRNKRIEIFVMGASKIVCAIIARKIISR